MIKVSLLAVKLENDSVDVSVENPSIMKPRDIRMSIPPKNKVDNLEPPPVSTSQCTTLGEVTEQLSCSCSFTGTIIGSGPGCCRNSAKERVSCMLN